MKKLVIALLAMLLVLGCAVALADEAPVASSADNCNGIKDAAHTYSTTLSLPGTCVAPDVYCTYCNVCGVKFYHNGATSSNPAHVYGEWETLTTASCLNEVTGMEIRYCTNKGCDAFETRTTEFAHVLAPWQTNTPAKCGVKGQAWTYCTVCKKDFKKDIPALTCDSNIVKVITPATCTATGEQGWYCSKCDTKQATPAGKNPVLPMIDHVLVDYIVKTPATCTVKGTYEATCSVCHMRATKDGQEWPATAPLTKAQKESLEIAALGHDYAVVSTFPTCSDDGEAVYTCTRKYNGQACAEEGYTYTKILPKSAEYHVMDEKVLVPATDTTDGLKHVWCILCDYNKDVVYSLKDETPDAPEADKPEADKPEADKPEADKPEADEDNGSANTPATTPSGVVIPATGDNTTNAAYVVLAAAIVGLAVLAISKKARA